MNHIISFAQSIRCRHLFYSSKSNILQSSSINYLTVLMSFEFQSMLPPQLFSHYTTAFYSTVSYMICKSYVYYLSKESLKLWMITNHWRSMDLVSVAKFILMFKIQNHTYACANSHNFHSISSTRPVNFKFECKSIFLRVYSVFCILVNFNLLMLDLHTTGNDKIFDQKIYFVMRFKTILTSI